MWFWLAKSILGGLIGSAFGKWFLTTKLGIWTQTHLDNAMEYLAKKYHINIIEREMKWVQDYPHLAETIAELQFNMHPPVAPGGTTEIVEKLDALQRQIDELKK